MAAEDRDLTTADLAGSRSDEKAALEGEPEFAPEPAGDRDIRRDDAPDGLDGPTADARATTDAADERAVPLLAHDEVASAEGRWTTIQTSFVDEPQKAVRDADALVAAVMQDLARSFAEERDRLESQWSQGRDVSTEDLRQALRRYRSFFQRLLAA